MRTVSASIHPFLTPELSASSGKSPVIMKRPYAWNIVFSDIFEKHIDIQIVITQRMDVNKIRFDLLQPAYKKPGIDDVEITIEAKKKRKTF